MHVTATYVTFDTLGLIQNNVDRHDKLSVLDTNTDV